MFSQACLLLFIGVPSMALETASFISDLVSINPTASDNISQGDDHIRLLKATIKATFPNITGAVTPTHTKINDLATVTGSETLTNKTLTTPVLSGTASGTTAGRLGYLSGALSYGNGTVQRTVVNTDEAQTLTNKVLNGFTGDTSVVNLGSGQFYKDTSGSVGIGTTSPGAKLDVVAPWSASPAAPAGIRVTSAAGLNDQFSTRVYTGVNAGGVPYSQVMGPKDNNGWLAFTTGPSDTERLRIDSSGNVGIGTSTIRSILTTAFSDATGSGLTLVNTSTANNTTKSSNVDYSGTDTAGTYKLSGYIRVLPLDANYISSYLTFATRNADAVTERMRIDNSGYTYETNAVNTQSTAATLTADQVLAGILVTSPSGAITLTMPTGTTLDAVFPNVTGMTRDLTVVNTTANTVTIAANTGITLTGGMQPTSSNPCLFRLRRTGTATYTMYRAG